MSQNTVQSSDALYPEDEIVYIATYSTSMTNDSLASLTGASWTNIGALSEFSRDAKIETQQPPSQNVEHQQVISRMVETINLSIQELKMANYRKLSGLTAYSTNTAGTTATTSYSYTTSAFPSTAIEMFIEFKSQNWSSTHAERPVTPGSIIITGSSTYVLDQDYLVLQNENYHFGFAIQTTGNISSTISLTVAYSFAPKAQDILVYGGADELTPFMLKIYSLYADGRTITTYYPRVEYVSGGSINDKQGNSGEFKDMKFSLEAREHESYIWNSKKVLRIDIQTTA
jgi:hypothetical protein